jgi:hypothetical protein
MGFLDKLFPPRPNFRAIYEGFLTNVVNGYRHTAAVHRCAPKKDISDQEICRIYETIDKAFQNVAKSRGERLSDETIFNIGLFFLQKYEMVGKANPEFFTKHIAYEVEKYQREGLRVEYNREISLIRASGYEQPEWYKQLPDGTKFNSELVLKDRLEILRHKLGLDDEQFLIALTTSRSMTRRSVLGAYHVLKHSMPGYKDSEYLAMTIMDRMSKKLAVLPFNTSSNPCTSEQLQKIFDEAESIATKLRDIHGVCHLLVEIEDCEGNFADPLGVIAQIDQVFDEYTTERRTAS